MQRISWIALAALFAAIGMPIARADSYIDGNMQFTVTGGNVAEAPTGSFVYDATTNLFNSIEIIWQGEIYFDFAPCADGLFDSGGTIICTGLSDPLTSYRALSSCSDGITNTCTWLTAACGPIDCYDAFSSLASGPWVVSENNLDAAPPGHHGNFAFGTFTTPEPGSFVLMLLGILFALVMRKRLVLRAVGVS